MKTKGYYDEGGFLDDGASVDPISGNDVPTGSLAEEVRDDVPAQLSEGEFVVPADVVRYIGLEKLMQMRDQAKSGLAQMEQEGQMGGSPAPMQPDMDDDDNQRLEMDALIEGLDSEDFEGAVQQFAEGGSVRSNLPSYETYTGRKFGEAATVEYRKYTNDEGDIIDVAFVRGKPVNPIPQGYYAVGSKGDEDEVPPEQTRSTVNGGMGDAQKIDRDYKNSVSYKNQLNKSMRLTGARQTVLLNLHKSNMTQAEIDNLYDHLTPMAQAEYESRFRDLKGLDKFFAANKSSAELMIAAQSQVNSRNYKNGVLETGSYTAPSGNIVTIEGIEASFKEAFKLTEEGKKALSLGTFATALAEALKLQFKTREGNGKVGDGSGDPSVRPAPPAAKLGQAHWKSRLEELTEQAKNGVITTKEISQIIRHERRSVVNSLGRTVDSYGNPLTNPSVYTIWDKIADNEMGAVAIAQAKITLAGKTPEEIAEDKVKIANTVVKVEDLYVRSGVEPSKDNSSVVNPDVVTPTIDVSSDVDSAVSAVVEEDTLVSDSDDFISPNVDPGLLAATVNQMNIDSGVAPSTSQSPISYDSAVPSTPAPIAQDVVDREDKLLKEMNGVPDTILNTAGTEYAPEGTGVASLTDVDPATPTVKPVVDSQLKMDLRNVANPVTSSAVTTGIPPAYSQAESELMTLLDAEDALSTGASLGTTATLGVTTELTPEETDKNNRAKVKKIAIANGFDVDLAIQAYENSGTTGDIEKLFEAEDSISRREQAFINKNDTARNDARDEAFNLIFANEAGLKKKLDPVAQAALTDEQRRQQSQTTTNSGNNNNDNYTYSPPTPTEEEKEEEQSDYDKMYGNAGGLAVKKKPAVKKMRKDPTSGLAAKKKSKQKAQAKKGALAAKRT